MQSSLSAQSNSVSMSWTATFVLLITTNVYGSVLKISGEADDSSSDHLTSSTSNDTCVTKVCENESALIKRWLKESIDPCDNFYDFACGYVEFIPGLQPRAYSQVSSETHNQLIQFLSEPLNSTDATAIRLTKIFYQSCVSRSMWKRSVTDSFLDKYGGWPLRDGDDWKSGQYDWIEVKKNMQIDGFYLESIFTVGFYDDFADDNRIVFYIDQGNFLLNNIYSKDIRHEARRYIKQRAKGPRRVFETELLHCIDFEKELQKIALTDDLETRFAWNTRSSIRQVQIDYPYINWLTFLNGCLNGSEMVTENDTVLVMDPDYFRQLGLILQKTTSRRIANYIGFATIVYGASRLHVNGIGVDVSTENCLLSTEESFPDLLGAIYVQNFVSKETKSTAIRLSEKIRYEFVKMLENASWLDNDTISAAVDKANAMDFNIAYCDTHINNSKLDKRYEGLDIQPNASYLQNLLQVNRFLAAAMITLLRQPLTIDDFDAIQPTSTSPKYWSDNNSIGIPAANLQGRFFSINRPPTLNFGGIGSVIGHEITHGFDKTRIEWDRYGNVLFRDDAQQIYNRKARCYEKQYYNFKHPSIDNLTVNGTLTLNENIADNVGIKAAYAAYQKFVNETGAGLKLPNLNFTADQLFWIAAAQLHCGRTYVLGFRVTTDYDDVHAPNRYRVIGMFRNSDEFARDFKCKVGSNMNPPKDEKCELW
ncbi:neprilysin-2-like [Bradysia coprophila]|uniref:neprilysin-2-like n=1 Tax=Bradysia coprophila TaxID=38358 RepID=UPI00187DCE73|nr:neprilysin-2-like [Bradysia coprophila]